MGAQPRLFGMLQRCGCLFGQCACFDPVAWGWTGSANALRETAPAERRIVALCSHFRSGVDPLDCPMCSLSKSPSPLKAKGVSL